MKPSGPLSTSTSTPLLQPLPTTVAASAYCGCKAQCRDFQAAVQLMSAWQGEPLHSQVPQMENTGESESPRNKGRAQCLQRIRGYDKSQRLSQGKVQLKSHPGILFHVGLKPALPKRFNICLKLSVGINQDPAEKSQPVCILFYAGLWNTAWWLAISPAGRPNLYCPRGEDGRDKGNCVISQSASDKECSERPETWGQQSSVGITTRSGGVGHYRG